MRSRFGAALALSMLSMAGLVASAQEPRRERPQRPDDAPSGQRDDRREPRRGPPGEGRDGGGRGGFGQGGFGPGGGPPGGPGGFGGGLGGPGMFRASPEMDLVFLVAIPEVQTEIGMKDDQKKAVADLTASLGEKMGRAMEGIDFREIFELEPEERDKKMASVREKQDAVAKSLRTDLEKLLDKKQVARLTEIDLQRAGSSALRRKPVAQQLKLSEEQQGKLGELLDSLPPFLPPEARQQVDEDSLAVLNKDQKDAFAKLKGKQFEFPPPAFGPPGGFAGGFQGGGPGGPGGPGGFGGGPGGPGGFGGGPGGPGGFGGGPGGFGGPGGPMGGERKLLAE
ncbi:MAG: hypothetical protein NT069_31800, partial [Planctomycetota bacterium]|nr:hypothetical protein [Planctomycetota bacterium]